MLLSVPASYRTQHQRATTELFMAQIGQHNPQVIVDWDEATGLHNRLDVGWNNAIAQYFAATQKFGSEQVGQGFALRIFAGEWHAKDIYGALAKPSFNSSKLFFHGSTIAKYPCYSKAQLLSSLEF